MNDIVVYLDSLHDVVTDIRWAMREMDGCVRRAYNEIHSINGSGRGLNDVRHRADELLRAHRALEETGTHVEQYVSAYAEAFAAADQELAAMVRSQRYTDEAYYASVLRSMTTVSQSLTTWMATFVSNADWVNAQAHRVSVWDLAERYTWIVMLTNLLDITTVQDWAKKKNSVIDKMGVSAVYASQIQALAAMLAQYIPGTEISLTRQSAHVATTTEIAHIANVESHISKDVSVFAHGLRTGDLCLWAETFASNRVNALHTAGDMVFTPSAYVYDAVQTRIGDASNGFITLGAAREGVGSVLDALPSDAALFNKNTLKWTVNDEYTNINTSIDSVVSTTVITARQLYAQLVTVL